MIQRPIRAVFILKEKGRRCIAPQEQPLIDELMGALRAIPKKASLARAAKALRGHYKIEMMPSAPQGSMDEPAPELTVVHFELTMRKRASLEFQCACRLAMKAMNLSPRGFSELVELAYPRSMTLSHSKFEELSLSEQIEFFKKGMGDILRTSSCALEKAHLDAHAPSKDPSARTITNARRL